MGRKIGLALGGGGARGIAHIGVLKVLEREGIPINLIAGTSIGALVGAVYAAGIGPEELERKAIDYIHGADFRDSAIRAIERAHAGEERNWKERLQSFLQNRFLVVQAMFKPGILSAEEFRTVINYFIPDIQIDETRIPFRAVATDLKSGRLVAHETGSLRKAVMASCAVPGAVEPLKEGEMILSDGGAICLVPISVARAAGADVVVAVTVDRDICTATEFRNARTVTRRAAEILARQLENYELMEADVVIRPNVGDLHWSEFSQAEGLVREGERAAREKLEEIRRAAPRPVTRLRLEGLLRSLRRRVAIGEEEP
ncbi:MAG: patatin-like phospholipase family protein [Candidatus Eisenbacteria bacterium]|nr:patatin-like phospholipase family protein [Candidatus Eisenbacteria bacterium]